MPLSSRVEGCQRVVAANKYRPPYLDEVFDILSSLMTDEPRAVLDFR